MTDLTPDRILAFLAENSEIPTSYGDSTELCLDLEDEALVSMQPLDDRHLSLTVSFDERWRQLDVNQLRKLLEANCVGSGVQGACFALDLFDNLLLSRSVDVSLHSMAGFMEEVQAFTTLAKRWKEISLA